MRKPRQKVKVNSEPMTRVIRATWDSSLDYEIPLSRAKQLYNQGKLSWDTTNEAYSSYFDWQNMRAGEVIR